MTKKYLIDVVVICFLCISLFSCSPQVYVSDLKIIHLGDIHGGLGIDKPYWTDQLIMCGIKYKKGVVIHPENGGTIAFAEFLLPRKGGHLVGTAGWAEQVDAIHNGRMRYRFFADGKLLYAGEIKGKDCEEVNLDLGNASVLRIETDDGDDRYWADHMGFGGLRIEY